jgi:hypothetical protein
LKNVSLSADAAKLRDRNMARTSSQVGRIGCGLALLLVLGFLSLLSLGAFLDSSNTVAAGVSAIGWTAVIITLALVGARKKPAFRPVTPPSYGERRHPFRQCPFLCSVHKAAGATTTLPRSNASWVPRTC